MPPQVKLLIGFLMLLGCLAFVYGIVKACWITLSKDPDVSRMPAFLSNVVTTIAAILATNLGAVLGITVTNTSTTSPFAIAKNWNPANVFSGDAPTVLQTTACYIYVAGLLAAGISWAIRNFTSDPLKVVPLLPELTKSLLGVIIGALAVSLNIPK